jgi:peptidoglycan/xylan/chitin deacetylase (PgdA/CDA1 family)
LFLSLSTTGCDANSGKPFPSSQYGFPATFFLIANQDSTQEPWDGHTNDWWKVDWREEDISMLRRVIQDGHEIGAHSVHHRYPFLDDDPKCEAEGSKQWIESRLGIEVQSYCYPFCHITEPIKSAVIGAGYKQARGGANAAYYPLRGSADWFNVDCREQDDDVNGWVRSDHWQILMFHGIGTEADGWHSVAVDKFAAQMAQLARLRDSRAVEVVTFRDGTDHLRCSK